MEKEEIKSLIIEYQQFVTNIFFVPRPIHIEPNANYIFVGLRRSGKSHILYQVIAEKIKKGLSAEQILFINFEDERFAEATTKDLTLIMESYKELYNGQPVVFLDEVQVIPGWQKFVRRLADMKYRIFVSGSNAEMLSNEIATTLGGRFIIYEVYPYSFEEFLEANDIVLKKNWEYGDVKNDVVKQLDSYFRYGGLPELLHIENKRPWISSLYQKIFFGDIVGRYNLRNDHALKMMIKKLAESVGHPISINRLANIVSHTGTKISVVTVMEYLKYTNTAWLIFSIPNYTAAISERESVKKYYFIDNGILNLFLIEGNSFLLENLVAIDLHKRYKESLCYYHKNIEVDFYIASEGLALQVCYSLSEAETLEREINALTKLSKAFPVKRAVIVTYNEERQIQKNGITIEVIPIWKWLLNK